MDAPATIRRRPTTSRRSARDFPILSREGLRQAAGLSRQCRLGAEAAGGARRDQPAYTEEYANVHRGLHFLANAATEAYEEARETVRALPECCRRQTRSSSPRSSTEGINLVAQSFGGMRIRRGRRDRALRSWSTIPTSCRGISIRERQGAVIKWAPVDDDGTFDLDEFEKLLTERTKIVAITHMSNVTRHRRADQGGLPHRACARHPGAGRRQPGGGASADRRAGPRLRLLRLHRPQDLRPDRHRRALGQARAPRRDAAVPSAAAR